LSFTILHTEWSSGWGGQEMRIVAESVAFQARGYCMLVAAQPGSQILARAAEAGLTAIPLKIRKGVDLLAAAACLRILLRHRVHLVHTHSSPDAWACGIAARLARVPVVRSRHLSTPIRRNAFSRLVYMKLADRVITSGQAIKDEMVHGNRMDGERIVSIPAGIDVKQFVPSADRGAARRELGLAEGDFVVGIVSVLRKWKGHRDLLEAVHRLAGIGVPAKLVIVGAGPQEENIRRRIAELGLHARVQMTGHRGDVPRLIAAMDCMALPSTANEATSQVLPQALAMKVPVVTTTVGGLPEVVRDRDTGLLVPPGDPAALTEALLWIYRNPAQAAQTAERGYAHTHVNFTFDGMIERTEAVYRGLLANATPG
jgi:glycosyltransferase involved in cell wall biosynthesis